MNCPKSVLALSIALSATALAQGSYVPADQGQRLPGGDVRILPEQFLRGYDAVTLYFPSDQVSDKANADDGAKRLKMLPEWPGAYVWVDRRTLQFRPAEPWPALARFQFQAGGASKTLTTMMSAPSAMSPSPGSDGLKPFRIVTLTFPQSLPVTSLKKMLTVEIRDLPGVADSPRRKVNEFALAPLPRTSMKDPATWALTMNDDVPEGKMLVVSASLALGSEGTTLWQGRVSTRTPFSLLSIRCGPSEFQLAGGGSTSKDLALGCGNHGDKPQLTFSAAPTDLTLTSLRKLVRLEPAVPDLRFENYGNRVQLAGKFVPDTLYKMTLGEAPLHDDSGRAIRDIKPAEIFFHLGWQTAFLKVSQGTVMLEAKGPRMLPMSGYGEAKADVRIYRINATHSGLWPFPSSGVVVNEQSAPPFPGEEPESPRIPGDGTRDQLQAHLRMLGSPLVSRVVDLPLANKSGPGNFGLDLKPLLDGTVGADRPGTYLVGVRRLTGPAERTYARVQITNLTLTAVEETNRAILYVRTLNTGDAVRGATVTIEGTQMVGPEIRRERVATTESHAADDTGRVSFDVFNNWETITRIVVSDGNDDVLVLDPRESPPSFENSHWSGSGNWLSWLLTKSVPPPVNDANLGFIFTERAIYKPGEPVMVKAFARNRVSGQLRIPGDLKAYSVEIAGPDGYSLKLPMTTTPLGALQGTFNEANLPTGDYVAKLSLTETSKIVATRNFKIEAYRLPTFEVQLTGAPRVRNDAPFKVKAIGRFYAGGTLSNQPIVWNVTQHSYYWQPQGLPGFQFASSTQFARNTNSASTEATKQEMELDDNGASELTLNPQLDLDGSARAYTVEATVTGPDDQPVTNSTEVKALPAFVLGLKVPRYLEKATELKPEIVVVGIDDKPIKGQEVRVRIMRRVWHSSLRETTFATGQAKYQTTQEDLQVAEKIVNSEAAAKALSFPIAESGVYLVELQARDKLGRVQTLSTDLYIGGSTPQAWQKSRDGIFELKPDKKTYLPGDTAHVVIQSPFTTARALIVIEEPAGNRYSWKNISGSTAVIDVPVTDRFVPNLPVHVVLMRGRLGEGITDDTRYKPTTVASTIELEVEPTKNSLNVNVQHPEVAKPGTTQNFTITLTDDLKKPVGGEVTLWLVDEAVLSLAKEGPLNPLEELILRNRRTVTIRDTRNLIVGRISELEEEPGGDGGGDEGESQGKRRVRKNFKTVPYYMATLTVPDSGKLVVPITLSDDLTNFKVRAVAVSGAQRFGYKQSVIHIRLPVLVQPQLPRFVRMGDRFWPGGIARLVEGPEGAGSVEVTVTGAVEGKTSTFEKIDLKATKPMSVLTPVTVKSTSMNVDNYVTVRVDVIRTVDKAGDAFETKLPLLPDRMPERSAYFTTFKPGATKLNAFPEPVRPGSVSQTIIVTNQPGLLELASGLEYLSAYPHGCLEQRMSQIWPDLALGGFLKKLELDTRFTPQVQANVKRMIEDMATNQDQQGFLSYWPGGTGDIALTAQGYEFMTAAKKAGISVDERVRARTLEALKRVLRTDFNGLYADYRFNQQTAALRALSYSGELDENYLIELFNQRKSMDATSVADLTSAMSRRPNVFSSNINTLKSELWDATVFKLVNGKPTFDSIRGDRSVWTRGYLGSSTSTASAVWEALLNVDPTNPKHTMIRDALLSRSSATNGFGSTHANRRAIAALGTYLEKSIGAQAKTTISIQGVDDIKLDDTKKAGRRSLVSDAVPTVSVNGESVSARIQMKFVSATPGDKAEPKKSGLLVTRSLTWLHPDNSAPTNHEDATGGNLKVGLGDILEVHTQLTNDETRSHVALVVPFAAGLEPMNPELATSGADAKPSQSDTFTPSSVQRLDSEVRYYFNELPRGTYSFHFRVRASSEGSFVHPSPWAEMMYREEVRGRGAGMRITVTGTREK